MVKECVGGWGDRFTTAKGEGFMRERLVIMAPALNPPPHHHEG